MPRSQHPKTTADKIYEQIDTDLKTAEESLPETWSTEYTGRLTWGAARSLHARTYMMRSDWDNMYKASTDVINKGLYNLKLRITKYSPTTERTAAVLYSNCNVPPLPPFHRVTLSAANSAKCKAFAEPVSGT